MARPKHDHPTPGELEVLHILWDGGPLTVREVWEMLDGSRTTAQIIQQFADSHSISSQEAERSVTLFLRELGKRGLIALR